MTPSGHAIASPVIFGCASLAASLTDKQSLDVLEAAWESGITHFDVARSYGYGRAEAVLGVFLQTHPKATVTTKCGILPPTAGWKLTAARTAARAAVRAVPALRRPLRRRASAQVRSGEMSPETLRASLEASRRELGREVLDLILLHEPGIAAAADKRLHDLLQSEVDAGRAAAWGLAVDDAAADMVAAEPQRFPGVIQLPTTFAIPDRPQRIAAHGRSVVVHSVISRAATLIHSASGHDRDVLAQRLDFDISNQVTLYRLLVRFAFTHHAGIPIIIASRSADHLRENMASAFERQPQEDERLPILREWLAVQANGTP